MRRVYADLHIHIGRTGKGQPVKITAARNLTFENIAKECATRKGIEVAGIVDCGSPAVLEDITSLISEGLMVELPGGGLRYREATTILLGCELETVEDDGAASHHVSYFPTLEQLGVLEDRSANLPVPVAGENTPHLFFHPDPRRGAGRENVLSSPGRPGHGFTLLCFITRR